MIFPRVDLAIHEHRIRAVHHDSGALIFRCDGFCDWWWWLAPVSAPSLGVPHGLSSMTAAEKAVGRRGVAESRARLAAAAR